MTQLFFLVFALCVQFSYQDGLLNVVVYTESECPDCQDFVLNQLSPNYPLLADAINLTVIPYGNAQQEENDEVWSFTCQHGPDECYGNKVESCILSFPDVSTQKGVDYLTCSYTGNIKDNARYESCCDKTGISWDDVNDCVTSKGDLLLSENGDLTHSVDPPILDIPAITFDGVHNYLLSIQARYDFYHVVCEQLDYKPQGCQSKIYS